MRKRNLRLVVIVIIFLCVSCGRHYVRDDNNPARAFKYAVMYGMTERALELLPRIQVNTPMGAGFNPLTWSIYWRQSKVAIMAIERGADVNTNVKGYSPLYLAKRRQLAAVIKMLEDRGALD